MYLWGFSFCPINLSFLAQIFPHPNAILSVKMHCFIALDGTFDGRREDEPGADFQIIKMQLNELTKTIED